MTERTLDLDRALSLLAFLLDGVACLPLPVCALHDCRRRILFAVGYDLARNVHDHGLS